MINHEQKLNSLTNWGTPVGKLLKFLFEIKRCNR